MKENDIMDRLLIDELKRHPLDLIKGAFTSFIGNDNCHGLCEIASDYLGENVWVNLDSAFDNRLDGGLISAAELVFNVEGYMVYFLRHDTDESLTAFVGMIANGFVPAWLSSFELIRAEGRFTIVAGRKANG